MPIPPLNFAAYILISNIMAKQRIRMFAATVILACAVFSVSASYGVIPSSNMPTTVTVVKIPGYTGSVSGEPGDPGEGETPNQRHPGKRITCTIDSTTGIQFVGQETPDFVYFEIYDSNDSCIGAFGDETEFITALFSLSGEYRILLNDTNSSYTGFVSL